MTDDLKDTIDNGESEVQITTIGKVVGSDIDGNPIEQNFTEAALSKIANSTPDEILIDADHESETGGSTEAKGWLSNLKFISGKGLFGKIKWTDIGRKLIENRVFRWLSPSWLIDSNGEPVKMTSVALTNKPSQAGRIQPIINSEPAAAEPESQTITPTNKKDILDMDKEELKNLIKEAISEMQVLNSAPDKAKADEQEPTKACNEQPEEKTDKASNEDPTPADTKEDKQEQELAKEQNIEDQNSKKSLDSTAEDKQPDKAEDAEQAKEDEDEKKEEQKQEVIKEAVLNSAPSSMPSLSQEPEWKQLKGQAFFDWIAKHPNGI